MGGRDKDIWGSGYKGSEVHRPVLLAFCDRKEHSIVAAIFTKLFWLLSTGSQTSQFLHRTLVRGVRH